MTKSFASIFAAALFAFTCHQASAQQPPCKGYYTVGETVPAGCAQQTINSSNYATWGNGQSAATAAPSPPPLFDAHSRGFMTR